MLIATQLLAVQDILAADNGRRVAAGETPDEVYPDAVAATEHAFRMVERGLGDLLRRPGDSTSST
ncbi:hypothetical protein AB0M97_05495 [Streptomyces sp. NPDC051207]|uniref:hypothetical protein n=1 Tax=Streptomyces sp. NPDC051207 TaxID=3154641 RepID=UPI00342D0138